MVLRKNYDFRKTQRLLVNNAKRKKRIAILYPKEQRRKESVSWVFHAIMRINELLTVLKVLDLQLLGLPAKK